MVDFREAREDADYDCFGCRNEPWPPLTAYEREAALQAWDDAEEWVGSLGRGFQR